MDRETDAVAHGAAGSPPSFCLANAEVVFPDHVSRAAITVVDGKIAEISQGAHVPPGAVDCGGDYLLPGLIELHTDNLERHIEPRPGVAWPHLAALVAHDRELASTGITTVFDALRVGSITGARSRYRPYARNLANQLLSAARAGTFKVSHFLHLRAEICSDTLLEELAEFGADDRVGILSLMDHTPGQRQFRDLERFRAYVTKKRGFTDAELETHIEALREKQMAFGASHEAGAVREAKRLNATLASHDDTTRAHVAVSRANHVDFAEFPTTLEAAKACRDGGIAVMMGAPNLVRGLSHSGNVSARELAEAGLLDIVSSDYVPAALLLATFQLADLWNDLPRAVACVSATPADVTGLGDRGRIQIGLRADILRVRCSGDTPLIQEVFSEGRRI